MQEELEGRKATKLDANNVLACLQLLKRLQAENQQENESDEYLDAFVALGGDVEKRETISKETLIHIIKHEFGLTIEMDQFLRKMDDTDRLNYD